MEYSMKLEEETKHPSRGDSSNPNNFTDETAENTFGRYTVESLISGKNGTNANAYFARLARRELRFRTKQGPCNVSRDANSQRAARLCCTARGNSLLGTGLRHSTFIKRSFLACCGDNARNLTSSMGVEVFAWIGSGSIVDFV